MFWKFLSSALIKIFILQKYIYFKNTNLLTVFTFITNNQLLYLSFIYHFSVEDYKTGHKIIRAQSYKLVNSLNHE